MASALLAALEAGGGKVTATSSAVAAAQSVKQGSSGGSSASTSTEVLVARIQRLEIREQLHAKAIVMQAQDLERIRPTMEVVVWVVAQTLKEEIRTLQEAWRKSKPADGPHPLGSMGHVTMAAVVRAVHRAAEHMSEDEVVRYQSREDAQSLRTSMEGKAASHMEAHALIKAQLAGFMQMSMTQLVANGRPINKKPPTGEKPWGWSFMMDPCVNGVLLRTWLLENLTPLMEQTGIVTARRGRPRRGGLIEEIAHTVQDWNRDGDDMDADGEGGGGAEEGGRNKKRKGK